VSDIYKFTAQNALRFPSKRGELTAEQLFDLPLKSQAGFDLDTVARAIHSQLKGVSEESFVEDTSADPRKTSLAVALDVVKDVIATKQAENRAAQDKTRKATERKKILDAIASKKDQALTAASLDDLEKQLAALEG
jgi:hypothetical protein